MFVEDFVECSFGQDCDISFIVPSSDGGLGQTVLDLAEQAEGESALIVLGDTHFQFADPEILLADNPTVLVQPVQDSYRWCTAEMDDQGTVTALHDKEHDLPGTVEALIGVYYFPQLNELRDAVREAVGQAASANRRTEMADILNLVRQSSPLKAVSAGDWLDCGNPDRQASSHRTLLQKREFNELSIDSVLGTITKRSRYVEKFLDEINYLRLLPPELAVLFPRVINYSTDWQDPWLTLEYYGYPTLAEVFVFENVDPGTWEQVFVHLREILLQGFMRHRRPLAPGVLEDMYLGKTRDRLRDMPAPEALLALARHEGPITVNGATASNIPALWPRVETEVQRHGRQRARLHRPRRPVPVEHSVRSAFARLQVSRSARQFRRGGHLRRSALRRRQAVSLDLWAVRLHHERLVRRQHRRHEHQPDHPVSPTASHDPRAVRKGFLRRI